MHWREQGDRGEASARDWFTLREAEVFIPLAHSRDVDFVVREAGVFRGVQVKTTGSFRNERWEVATCTRGGNQSWNGIVKRLDASKVDYLFVLVADGRRWRIPAPEVDGRTMICLGGPAYAKYEVEPALDHRWEPTGV